jgi:hypothetical protein
VLAAGGTRALGSTAIAASPTSAAAPQHLQNLFTTSEGADLDFDMLFAFGGTGYGSAEFGELVTAVNAAGASYQTFL